MSRANVKEDLEEIERLKSTFRICLCAYNIGHKFISNRWSDKDDVLMLERRAKKLTYTYKNMDVCWKVIKQLPNVEVCRYLCSMKSISRLITLLSVLLLCFGCSEKTPSVKESQQRDHENAVYFWKTRFELGDEEMAFLRDYSIKRIYLKYFDVDYENNPVSEEEGIVPVGTASFVSCRPKEIEIVPTVFITVKALVYIRDNKLITDSAWKIVCRILNMSSYNSMGSVREVQLDCDWTESTQETYFALCRAVKDLLNKDNIITSSTIRLHQLRLPAPPVERGVLMLYNTGAMRDPSANNSILDINDVKVYLKGTPVKYGLPLDFAYPTYSWGLWFRDHEFMGILHTNDYSDVSRYTASGEDGTSFLVHKEHILEGHRLIPGDMIRLETSDSKAIMETASLVTTAFPGTHSNIIYHLDSKNLKHYTQDEIKDIFGY